MISLSLQEHIATERRLIKEQILAEESCGNQPLNGHVRLNLLKRSNPASPWSSALYGNRVCHRHANILGDYVKARFYQKAGEVLGDTHWDEETGLISISAGLHIDSDETLQSYTDIIQWAARESISEVFRWHQRGAIEEIFTVRGRDVLEARHSLTNIEVVLDAEDANDVSIIEKVSSGLKAAFPFIGEEAEAHLKSIASKKNTWLSDLIGAATQFVQFEYRPLGA